MLDVKQNFERVHVNLGGYIIAAVQIGPNLLFTWVLPLLYSGPAHGVFPWKQDLIMPVQPPCRAYGGLKEAGCQGTPLSSPYLACFLVLLC